MLRKVTIPSTEDVPQQLLPERRLYAAIFERAYLDINITTNVERHIRLNAIEWFRSDFYEELAEFLGFSAKQRSLVESHIQKAEAYLGLPKKEKAA